MSYTIVNVTNFYPGYFKYYYSKFPPIINNSYHQQLAHMMEDAFGLADFYSKNLRALGVNAYDIIYNASVIQNIWAKENGFKGNYTEILIEQLKTIKPDVVFFTDQGFTGHFAKYIKDQIHSVRQTIVYCGSPYNYITEFKEFDFIVTCSPGFESDFKKNGLKAYHINHAFEHTLLQNIDLNNSYEESDLIFVGGFTLGSGYHNQRYETILKLIEKNINLKVYGLMNKNNTTIYYGKIIAYLIATAMKNLGMGELAKKLPYVSKAFNWKNIPQKQKYSKLFLDNVHPPLFGLEMLKTLSKAKICFNIHGEIAGRFAANMRLFEVTGVGSCLVTDWKDNIAELFLPDKEVITYKTVDECIEKVRWLLDHPIERNMIAKAGQKRCLNDHSYKNRAVQLDKIIKARI